MAISEWISRYFVSDTLTPIRLDIYQPLTTQMEAFNVNIKKNKDIKYILILYTDLWVGLCNAIKSNKCYVNPVKISEHIKFQKRKSLFSVFSNFGNSCFYIFVITLILSGN